MTKAKGRISAIGTTLTFLKSGWSEAMLRVLNHAFDHSLKQEEHASMPFVGGIMQHGYQCGMIWGAALAAGAQAYRLYGTGPQAETRAIIAAQRLVESFGARNKNINCLEITELNKSSSTMKLIKYFVVKGGAIDCLRMAARYAPQALKEINTAFSETHIEVPSPPISCTAILAQKMGVSEMHRVMTAGFAGGIGLSGGACGALGAAIWIIGMNSSKERDGKIDYNDPKAVDAIERFLKCSDYEFECTEIVGRKFENIDDHASYLREGGCSKIIEVLASKGSSG